MEHKLKHRFHFNKLIIILMLFVFIGVGYALNMTPLTINGNTKVKRSWNLVLDNIKKTSNSVDTIFSNISLNTENGEFSLNASNIELSSLEDYLEFEFDIINLGDYDVKVSDFNIILNEENYRKYFITSINYSDGTKVNVGDKILKGQSKKFICKLVFNNSDDVNLADILGYNSTGNKINISFNFNITYEQA